MRILCIGDSNTWGYHPGNGLRQQNRWTKQLAAMLPEDEIIEEGLNGRTLVSHDSIKPERCGMASLQMLLSSHQPLDWIVVMLGTNEMKHIFSNTAAHIAAGVRKWIQVIQNPYQWERYPMPHLLIVAPILIRDVILQQPDSEFDGNSLEQSARLSAEIQKVCQAYHVNFLDGAQCAEASLTDGIHMDEENHRNLAMAVFEKLQIEKTQKGTNIYE